MTGGWQDGALCAQVDPELFFPEKGHNTAEARRICFRCPVRVPCLQYALDGASTWQGIDTGVWGGLTARERMAIRHERKAA
jgi:WhiB family redox-sensing transcriptional regulator